MQFEKWEIWNAKVAFEDRPNESKIRPVLIIDSQTCYVLALKITHHEPREAFAGEYAITKWKEAGLDCPSTVRCTKKIRLQESDLLNKRGRMEPADVIPVMALLRFINA